MKHAIVFSFFVLFSSSPEVVSEKSHPCTLHIYLFKNISIWTWKLPPEKTKNPRILLLNTNVAKVTTQKVVKHEY